MRDRTHWPEAETPACAVNNLAGALEALISVASALAGESRHFQ